MVMTMAILSVGFSVFLFASSPPIRYFGMLSLATLAAGLAGDGILLPVLLRMLDSKGTRRSENA
jgi:predicted RND superfamily exporter protein